MPVWSYTQGVYLNVAKHQDSSNIYQNIYQSMLNQLSVLMYHRLLVSECPNFSGADVGSFTQSQAKYSNLFFMGPQTHKLEINIPFLPPLEHSQVLDPFIFLNSFYRFY